MLDARYDFFNNLSRNLPCHSDNPELIKTYESVPQCIGSNLCCGYLTNKENTKNVYLRCQEKKSSKVKFQSPYAVFEE